MSESEIYGMLRKIDANVAHITATMDNIEERVADHEARLRQVEQRENLDRRVANMEQEMRSLQRIVWAIPSASTIIAAAAIVISLLKF
jgi:hypothetical protein